MKQGPWTRVRPLQSDEVDSFTAAAYAFAQASWGGLPSNLMKVMGHCPQLAATEVSYANAVIFDVDVFNNGHQIAGFLDRPLKELVISRTSLHNRSRYSVTHHSMIGMTTFRAAGREAEGHKKLLVLHEHGLHPELYTAREYACLTYTAKVTADAHLVSDEEFAELKAVLRQYNTGQAPAEDMTDFDRSFIAKWSGFDDAAHDRLVDSQIVEMTWLIGQFCLLNRWFTVLQVPDEGPEDEANFLALYEAQVPADIRSRNDELLAGGF